MPPKKKKGGKKKKKKEGKKLFIVFVIQLDLVLENLEPTLDRFKQKNTAILIAYSIQLS